MTVTEVEFELSAAQHKIMGFPRLRQGEPLDVIFDGGVLLPDSAAYAWYVVQPDALAPRFVQIGRATYAFAGRITAADIVKDDGVETATVAVACDGLSLRVTCAPQEDGRLPYGLWETRFLAGICSLQGIVEDDFVAPIGDTIGVTIWGVRRLMLAPGDPNFGQWHESEELLPVPYRYDRVLIQARLHRSVL